MFGPHLTLDFYGCDKKKLSDKKFVHKILSEMPDNLGMNKFSEPQVTEVPSQGQNSFDRGGITGFVILVESHMTIHTFPEDGYASFDIFSCKEFDAESASDIIASKFEAKTYERNFMMRGRHFPKDIARSRQIVELERESSKVKEPKL